MTNEELQTVVDLERVRTIRAALEALDASSNMGTMIEDGEHATMRRTARQWEQKLQGSIVIKAPRADKGKARNADQGVLA
jgi:hypothetical protein